MTEGQRVTTPKLRAVCPKCHRKQMFSRGKPTGKQVSIDDYKVTEMVCSNCGHREEI